MVAPSEHRRSDTNIAVIYGLGKFSMREFSPDFRISFIP